ncbi:hypothetical protein TruAng_008690 [Truncatella angustata]|nr:hypothetical protein TruAng_008690 [Truncatella angustata]
MTGKTFCDQHNCLWSRCINARAIMRELPANIPPGFCEVHKCQILACQAPKMLRSEVHPPKIAQDKLMQKGLNTAELLYHALANTGPTTQFLQVLRAIKDIATYMREHQCKEDPACEEYVMDRGMSGDIGGIIMFLIDVVIGTVTIIVISGYIILL